LVEDAFDLAAVEVEFAGDGALVAGRSVLGADGVLRGWRSWQF
jgi:hypothetical protein